MEPASTIFRFGDYESRSRTRELYVRGSKLKIRPQPLRVLNLLLARAGDVVTREELRRELWSSEIFVDFEHVLNTSIKEIRAVLNDSATEPKWIETLPKLGYRFIAPVEKIEPTEAAGAVAAAGAALSMNSADAASAVENFADAKFSEQASLPAGRREFPSFPIQRPCFLDFFDLHRYTWWRRFSRRCCCWAEPSRCIACAMRRPNQMGRRTAA